MSHLGRQGRAGCWCLGPFPGGLCRIGWLPAPQLSGPRATPIRGCCPALVAGISPCSSEQHQTAGALRQAKRVGYPLGVRQSRHDPEGLLEVPDTEAPSPAGVSTASTPLLHSITSASAAARSHMELLSSAHAQETAAMFKASGGQSWSSD